MNSPDLNSPDLNLTNDDSFGSKEGIDNDNRSIIFNYILARKYQHKVHCQPHASIYFAEEKSFIDKEKDIKKRSRKNSIGIRAGVSISYRSLESDVHHQLVNHKNDHETRLTSTTFGVLYNRQLTSRIAISSGVFYSSFGENYGFHHDLITHEAANKYEYIGIPIQLSMQILNWRKWSLAVSGGAKLNLLYKAQSSWVDVDALNPVTHSNEERESSPFATRSLVWTGDFNATYHWNENLFFSITQSFDRFKGSVYKDDVQLQQQPFSFNTLVGIGYRF